VRDDPLCEIVARYDEAARERAALNWNKYTVAAAGCPS
jgi:hypothetical protein